VQKAASQAIARWLAGWGGIAGRFAGGTLPESTEFLQQNRRRQCAIDQKTSRPWRRTSSAELKMQETGVFTCAQATKVAASSQTDSIAAAYALTKAGVVSGSAPTGSILLADLDSTRTLCIVYN
jgi:hypothetical protein